MIFRHSFDQVSFLHVTYSTPKHHVKPTPPIFFLKKNTTVKFQVYHHSMTFIIWWFNMAYYPGGEAWPSAFLNSCVHVIMYSYYVLATLQIYPWWKKYLTSLQIFQLSLFVVQGIELMFSGESGFRWIGLVNGAYAATLVVLFVRFYVKSYGSKRNPTEEKRKEE